MIPQSSIDQWRKIVPWSNDLQVEQDLVLSRAVIEIFADDDLRQLVAMRGGTVLNKLYFGGASRYSEDVDLVWVKPGKAGLLIDGIRKKLDFWLGKPKRELSERSIKLIYRFPAEIDTAVSMRLKIEINTMEHFSVTGYVDMPYEVNCSWFTGKAVVKTYSLNELLGTKLRALYQRKKGRDLFDLWYALEFCSTDPEIIGQCFLKYMAHGGRKITQSGFDSNLQDKETDKIFSEDIRALLRPGLKYDIKSAIAVVRKKLITLLPE
jgi:predicted nucleotidyltransferase component of viral defense system